jgi:Holliday junction DNA helicase RuvA
MIGRLKGTIDAVGEDYLILDVHGVGYVVNCSVRTLRDVPDTGTAASFSIETQVREDSIRLFGFASDLERDWFRLLQTVQGVGAKVALGLLGISSPGELAQAIALQDKALVARAPGVGPKLAARIVAELKDKAPAQTSLDPVLAGVVGAAGAQTSGAVEDAIMGLVGLGYQRAQAAAAVGAALRALGEGAATAALLKRGLRELAA